MLKSQEESPLRAALSKLSSLKLRRKAAEPRDAKCRGHTSTAVAEQTEVREDQDGMPQESESIVGTKNSKYRGKGKQALSEDFCGAADMDTDLHLVCGSGSGEDVEACLAMSSADVNACGTFGFTPLFWAAQSGNLSATIALLQAGAEADARDCHGSTPLLLATAAGHADIALVLLSHGADPNASGACEAPLHRAASGSIQLLKALVAHGAEVTAASAGTLQLPLHIAASSNNAEAVSILLDSNSPVDAVDSFLFTPLHFAAGRGHLEAAKLLLSRGADPSAQDINSFAPLHLAAGGGHTEMVHLLLEHGADPNLMTDPHRIVPIALAVSGWHRETAKALLDGGARIHWVKQHRTESPVAVDDPTAGGSMSDIDDAIAAMNGENFVLNPLMVDISLIPNYEHEVSSMLMQPCK